MKPEFKPGNNIAIKVPQHEFDKTIHFYGEILGFERNDELSEDTQSSIVFRFGSKNLWIDKCPGISQAEIWLEITTDNIEQAQKYLEQQGCTFRNEIEILPSSVKGFWLSSPSNIIHLVVEP